MTDLKDDQRRSRAPFPGLTPSAVEPAEPREPSRLGRGLRKTLPLVVASAMTVGLNLTGPIEPALASPKKPAKPKADLGAALRGLVSATRTAATPVTPTYTVQAGDTVASIAVKHGLSTASVLALNGLGWKSLIFPGQVLKLSPGASLVTTPASTEGKRYTIESGDSLARIADRFGIAVEDLLRANGLSWSSIIYPGQTIAIPPKPPAPAKAEEKADKPKIQNVSSVTPAKKPSSNPGSSSGSGKRTHTIASGETISSIAAKYGVTVQAILDANGLTSSSIIYPGGKLVIPKGSSSGGNSGGAGSSGGNSGGSGGSVTSLSKEQEANAKIIIQVGRELGVPSYGIIIALATAMQESSLRNINYGDRDSVGLFQQRPSTGWGTVEQIMNPYHAAKLFYVGRSGYTRGLLDIKGWQDMPLTVAAQKVQISAYPDAYAKWETSARAWFAALG